MSNNPILSVLGWSGEYQRLRDTIRDGEGAASVFGVGEGHKIHLAASLSREFDCILYVAANEASAVRAEEQLRGFGVDASHFPLREVPLSGKLFAASQELTSSRLKVLSRLNAGSAVVTASAEALMQRIAPPDAFAGGTMVLNEGEAYDIKALLVRLLSAGYERVEQCEGRGQFALRGGILDVFPAESDLPYRLEFFDDEIDSVRTFDPVTQRSVEKQNAVRIIPATELPLTEIARQRGITALKKKPGNMQEELEALQSGATPCGLERLTVLFYPETHTLLSCLPKGAVIVIEEPQRVYESAETAFAAFSENVAALLEGGEAQGCEAELYISPADFIKGLETVRTVMLFSLTRSFSMIRPKAVFRFEARAVAKYSTGMEALHTDIISWLRSGYTIAIYAGNHMERLRDQLSDSGLEAAATEKLNRDLVQKEFIIVGESLPFGFEYPEIKLALITEAELYGSARRRTGPLRKRPQLVFSDLSVGDLVVHETHGIGRFTGVESLTVQNNTRDYLLLQYAGGDKLYIPTDQLDRVQKYIGATDAEPKLSKLGGTEWQKAVSRTREGVKALAMDLVKLYGERQRIKGFVFSADTPWQRRMEENFPYEETPDQLTSIEEVKRDMESGKVMDRLLCGDVGYGKTEVALRAAFKAVMDSKQVAFLVPTTILAQQHYSTLCSRFSGFPVTVELLSRFKNAKEQSDIIKRIANGRVDVVVGTHKLLSSRVKFKDLGLLIVDEEQRFGVGHKEKIKDIRRSVDVLTLTATPIPRTLHMSMTGIRDMSVIETPPEQRYPVQTYVVEYSDAIVREAVLKELGRGGQVYIVYNRVRSIEGFASRMGELLPEARIAFAHGQMNERILERTMLDFLNGAFDVLVCSAIIESGMDIPNVNTIIVYDADHFGLSQLYQLRGRVGRSTRLGYAYLTFRRDKVLTETAEKRLTTIREFTQFGSGFKIAMRDLEIRGAGNLLGPEQHGHMAEVGYDFYCKLMAEEVSKAKGIEEHPSVDCSVDIPVDAHIPHNYISGENRRLEMYKRIASISTTEDMFDVQEELEDRYGDIPKSVQNLMDVALIKANAELAYITQLTVREGEMRFTFHKNAKLNGAKLFELCSGIKGAHLVNAESTVLAVIRNNRDVQSLLSELPHFVYMLMHCIDKY
ncbi:MAG: Transcription-repair-coupling factor [Firmicutes bacterium ADurb.Bin182]|nr:MAG: Transcription-repair-coupling factor [Firmicutes bacterium ADurb.Bin182]